MPSKTPRVAIIGLTGQAAVHRQAVQWLEKSGKATLHELIVFEDEQKQHADVVSNLLESGRRIHSDFETFLQKGNSEIVTIPTGIHEHVPMSIAALQAGLHVYCEKPTGATVQDVDTLIPVLAKTDRKLVVGFQHLYSPSIRNIKARICEGKLGGVVSITVHHSWPRSVAYYKRNNWAGRMQENGAWVLDSPANNAMAHYLLNMLYLSSAEPNCSANPTIVRAELYRVNKIESCDLVQIKFRTNTGVSCFTSLAHGLHDEFGPRMTLECENGTVRWQSDEGQTVITYANRSTETFDNRVEPNWRFHSFLDLLQAIKENRDVICTPALTRSHTLAINAMHESCPEIAAIPETFVNSVEQEESVPPHRLQKQRYINERMGRIKAALYDNRFLSKAGFPWADLTSRDFETKDYSYFPEHPLLKQQQEAV